MVAARQFLITGFVSEPYRVVRRRMGEVASAVR
jgi:hypothetical protein